VKIGFLGFGEVASTLAKGLLEHGVEVSTCITGRSSKTVLKAEESGVNLFDSNAELAKNSDMLLSTVVPGQAVNVAQEIEGNFKGIYVDLNNVAPYTVKKCSKFLINCKLVDAAIIGSIRSGLKTPIIASGKHSHEFAKLNDYGMNIEVIGDEIGQASSIKLLRSSFTKSIAALLFETMFAAYKMGLEEKVLEFISRTECPEFKDSSKSRIISSAYHSNRRLQEMEEIVQFLSDSNDLLMSRATLEFYENLDNNFDHFKKRPEDYQEIFNKLKKNLSEK